MANPGKNKLVRYARILVDEFHISGDARTFSSCGVSVGEVDMTGWSNTIRQQLSDRRIDAGIMDFQAFFNDAADQSFDALQNTGGGHFVSVLFGGNAEPEAGDPTYFLAASQRDSTLLWDNQAGLLQATWRIDSSVANASNPLGNILHPITSISATTVGSTLDGLAATTNGWHANLHIPTVAVSGSWVLKVRHSTDDVAYSDLGTFSADGSVVAAEHIGGSGTVNRYVRFEGTRTSGTLTPVVTFARN